MLGIGPTKAQFEGSNRYMKYLKEFYMIHLYTWFLLHQLAFNWPVDSMFILAQVFHFGILLVSLSSSLQFIPTQGGNSNKFLWSPVHVVQYLKGKRNSGRRLKQKVIGVGWGRGIKKKKKNQSLKRGQRGGTISAQGRKESSSLCSLGYWKTYVFRVFHYTLFLLNKT